MVSAICQGSMRTRWVLFWIHSLIYVTITWSFTSPAFHPVSSIVAPIRSLSSTTASKQPPPQHRHAVSCLSAGSGSGSGGGDSTRTCPYTIQILMSDTGGGHRASANALRDAMEVLYPGEFECDIVDIYTDYGPFWPFNWYVPAYKIMAEYDFLWKTFYEFGSTEFGLWLNELVLDTFCFDSFRECLDRPSGSTSSRADMVISVHPLCQDLPLKILAFLDTNGRSKNSKDRTTPFATVVTDLGGAHPTWFNPGVDTCFVPSDVLYQCALARNVQPSQIIQHGLPIRKGFWGDENTTVDVSDLRQKLGLRPSVPTVLVVGGGDGMGGIVQVATALGQKLSSSPSSSSYQMVVVCGNNQAARDSLITIAHDNNWTNDAKSNVAVFVQGFVDNMDEWMKASDAIVTKAGPGTIAEASICGLPCLLSSFLPGQEEGNVPYVETKGFGRYDRDPLTLAETMNDWLASPQTLRTKKEAALEAARPRATLDIARDLAQMVFENQSKKD